MTHRDKPEDPELNSKLNQINRYQKEIMKMTKKNKNFKHKYSNISYKYKVKEMSDQAKVLQSGRPLLRSALTSLEIDELQNECKVIQKENRERQMKSIKLIQDDQGHETRISGLRDTMAEAKSQIAMLEDLKAQQNEEYDVAMNELRKANNEFRSLREK